MIDPRAEVLACPSHLPLLIWTSPAFPSAPSLIPRARMGARGRRRRRRRRASRPWLTDLFLSPPRARARPARRRHTSCAEAYRAADDPAVWPTSPSSRWRSPPPPSGGWRRSRRARLPSSSARPSLGPARRSRLSGARRLRRRPIRCLWGSSPPARPAAGRRRCRRRRSASCRTSSRRRAGLGAIGQTRPRSRSVALASLPCDPAARARRRRGGDARRSGLGPFFRARSRRAGARDPVHPPVPFLRRPRHGLPDVPLSPWPAARRDRRPGRLGQDRADGAALQAPSRAAYDLLRDHERIYTKEDARLLTVAGALPEERIMGVETRRGCPHTAIREDFARSTSRPSTR